MEFKAEEKPKNNVEKKPKPPLMVRQTLTSYKRMLKANPLLKYQEAGIDIDEILAQKSLSLSSRTGSVIAELDTKPSTSQFKKPESKPLMRTQSLKLPKSSGNSLGAKKPTVGTSENRSLVNNNLKKKTVALTNNISKDVNHKRPPIYEIKAKVNSFPKRTMTKPTDLAAEKPKPEAKPEAKKQNSPLRKSLSSGHLQMKKGQYFNPKQAYGQLNYSKSEEHLCIPISSGFKEISPIMEENGERNFVFKTPSAYDRRSICHFTPQSNRRTTLFRASTPAPVEMKRLQERLNKWLKSRGKPPASFHHLKIFGVNEAKKSPLLSDIDNENKENIEVLNENSESYENLMITPTKEDNVETIESKKETSEEDLSKYAKEAMIELLKLIQEDYPRDQCLGWLELIRDKYRKVDNEPEYWECRAAIEQSVGNVRNAVEFYKTAIIQGAEVNAVDKSLDQLLKKFSLLNISPSKSEQKVQGNSDKERIVREARNVFKSSIIQFAVSERNLKKTKDKTLISVEAPPQKKLVATPVRRSTRLSRSGYTSTAGVKLCTSLKEIDLSQEEICFETNKALC